jgi:hypothetical protein
MVLNYKNLNSKTITEQLPLPRIDEILEKLATSKYFSKIDLRSGYYQIPLDETSKKYTAFQTSTGSYEFNRCPFGLKNLPFEFSRIMRNLLSDVSNVEHFIDDIIVHSESIDEHTTALNNVLERLHSAKMKINLNKCKFFSTEIFILGHKVAHNKIMLDDSKVDCVLSRQPPQTVKQLERFLGLTNYFRKFIKDYSTICKPLTNLLRKNTKWVWCSDCQNAFDNLKHILTSYPILQPPDYSRKFEIHCDASNLTIGAILIQKDDNNQDVVIAYASKSLTDAEVNWTVTEKECYAVIWSIKHFRPYIYGTNFDVITDHRALVWLFGLKDPTGRLARWATYLQAYDFKIIHRKGSEHIAADAISRPVYNIQIEHDSDDDSNEDVIEIRNDPHENLALIHYLKYARCQPGTSTKQCKRVRKMAQNYKLIGNKLLFRSKNDENYLIYPIREDREKIILKEHKTAHFQTLSVYNTLKQHYFWKNMIKDIEKVVKRCKICHRNDRARIFHHPALALNITGIFDRVAIDLVLGLDTTREGYKGILTITEHLTNFIIIYPIKTKMASEIARVVYTFFERCRVAFASKRHPTPTPTQIHQFKVSKTPIFTPKKLNFGVVLNKNNRN